MIVSYSGLMKGWGCVLGVFLLGSGAWAGSRPLTAEEIADRMVKKAAETSSSNRRADYSYSKASFTEHVDGEGKVEKRKEKLIHFQGGKGSVVQIKVNGRALSPEELKEEQREIEEQDAKMTQSSMSRRTDNWEQLLTPDLLSRYTFRLAGEEVVNGRRSYVLTFRPKSDDLPVKQITDRVVNQLTGKLWVDAEDFEIAQARMWLLNDVTMWGGLLASLRKFDYLVERVRLEDGVWANRATRGEFRGRKLFGGMHVRTRSECKDFQKTTTASTQ
jgi:hypothetical protein